MFIFSRNQDIYDIIGIRGTEPTTLPPMSLSFGTHIKRFEGLRELAESVA